MKDLKYLYLKWGGKKKRFECTNIKESKLEGEGI